MSSHSHDLNWQRRDDAPNDGQGRTRSASLVDPEDDLPSAAYAGDFETTTIPHYSASNSAGGDTGLNLIGHQEPLPYVEPELRRGQALPAPVEIDDAEDDGRVRAAGRRGTQDLGLLILRAGLGALLFAHGLQKLFGWWGGPGLTGFKNSLSASGYQHAEVLTYVAAGGQIAAGVLLVLGLFTPLAAAGALAFLINGMLVGVAAQPIPGQIPFFLPDGHEYEIALIIVAATLVLTGPGRYGFDSGRGWARRPFIGSFLALLLGIGGGIALWVLLNGTNPLV